jgi:hypothetical protein
VPSSDRDDPSETNILKEDDFSMVRKALTKKPIVVLFLIVQFIPLILFPASTFKPTTQDWWLPVLLIIMIIAADFELFVQRRDVMWPWYLISFAQGFNIISRLMMIMPHATINSGGHQVVNSPYLILTFISLLVSTVFLWFVELPDVRMVMLRE